jgi:glucose uptake protein GlcU
MLKKSLIVTWLGVVGAISLGLGKSVFAALDPSAVAEAVNGKIVVSTSLMGVVFNVLSWVLGATFGFAVLMLVIGGFRYITSAGNESQAEAAKETMTKAIFGLVIILLAFVIGATINTILLGSSSGSSNGPCQLNSKGQIVCYY